MDSNPIAVLLIMLLLLWLFLWIYVYENAQGGKCFGFSECEPSSSCWEFACVCVCVCVCVLGVAPTKFSKSGQEIEKISIFRGGLVGKRGLVFFRRSFI